MSSSEELRWFFAGFSQRHRGVNAQLEKRFSLVDPRREWGPFWSKKPSGSKSFPGLDATPPLPAAAPPPAVRPRADTAELLTPTPGSPGVVPGIKSRFGSWGD